MSKFNPHLPPDALYAAVDIWKSRCLQSGGSLFSNRQLWAASGIRELLDHFVNSLDESDQNFIDKLQGQLAGTSSTCKQLAAEMLYVMFLCPCNTGADKKREIVQKVWSWSGEQLDASHLLLNDDTLRGVGSGGTGFNTNRWREFRYFILFMQAYLALPDVEREALMADGDRLAKWLQAIPENESRQFRHMLLFMLFPDQHERVFGGTDRVRIVAAFTGEDRKSVNQKYSAYELDQRLLMIRRQQEEKYGTTELDFYLSPLREVWQGHAMRHWLFCWNPANWSWDDLPQAIDTTLHGNTVIERWSCANRDVAVGDRAWLMRLGEHPKGVMAVGNVVSEPYEMPHYDPAKAAAGQTRQCVDIEFTRILDVFRDPFVSDRDLAGITVEKQNWSPQSSGIEIKPRSAVILEKLWNQIVGIPQPPVPHSHAGAHAVAVDSPTNLILYGPPGTGKTFELAKLAELYVSAAKPESREQWLAEQLREERWFDVVFMALYALGKKAKVKDIVEHEFVVQKAKTLGRTQNITQQVWASLQNHAVESSATVKYGKRFAPFVFDKDDKSVWSLVSNWGDECYAQVQLADRLKAGQVEQRAARRYEFVTFHQAYSYEDFVEGIRPVQDEETGDLVYRVMPGVFRRICQRAKEDPANRYAIFIDEINRGNIARIFGELITLIEVDKRARYNNAGDVVEGMSLTLPYSGDLFSVPANLDIYGSMNTADRSIALLDTALRRRFNFKELMPDARTITGSRGDGYIEDGAGGVINLRSMLEVMNRRIRFLLNRDLMLGHAYLCKVRDFAGLRDVLLNQLVPLLQEYFYNDWHRIQLVFRDIGEGDKRIEPQIIIHERLSEEDVLGFDHDDFEDLIEYRVARPEEITPEAIRKIYE